MSESIESQSNVNDYYNNQLRNYPRLSLAKEQELGRKILLGDENARNELVNGNLRLVAKLAFAYRRLAPNVGIDDIIQNGNMGLIRAAEKYDVNTGYRFSTYATWWIKQGIISGIRNENSPIRLPVYVHEQIYKMNRQYHCFMELNNREPTTEELSQLTDISPDGISQLIRVANSNVVSSLDGYESDNAENADIDPLSAFISSPDNVEEIACYHAEQKDLLAMMKSCLNKKEIETLIYRFGLFGRCEMTLQAISDHLNISKERVRQIEKKALEKLSLYAETKGHFVSELIEPNKKKKRTCQNEIYKI